MDISEVPTTGIKSRKNEARSLVRKCFENPLFSFVPFEIWRDIVGEADVQTIKLLSSTCWGFKELADQIKEKILEYALKKKKEGFYELASKYLLRSGELGNAAACLHLGFAFKYAGWGFAQNHVVANKWWKKGAESGNASAMAFHAYNNKHGSDRKTELADSWTKKALASADAFAVGYCYYNGLVGGSTNARKALSYFEIAAEKGDYAQYWLGHCFQYGSGTEVNEEKAFSWYIKSGEQGQCHAQYCAGMMYRDGKGCEKNIENAILWLGKAANQGHEVSRNLLKSLQRKM